MNQNSITTLTTIGTKPGTTKRDGLTITRRVLRLLYLQRDGIHAERRAIKRQAGKLRQFLPFTAQAVSELEQQALEHRARELEDGRRVLVAFGSTLLLDADGIADDLGFEQLADLLNINPVHREQARRDGGETLRGLAFVAHAEDSATQHGDTWGDGGPLFRACLAATCEFIRNAPEGALPDPFAPGAPFGPRLPPDLRVV
jgi:hypothetical protein